MRSRRLTTWPTRPRSTAATKRSRRAGRPQVRRGRKAARAVAFLPPSAGTFSQAPTRLGRSTEVAHGRHRPKLGRCRPPIEPNRARPTAGAAHRAAPRYAGAALCDPDHPTALYPHGLVQPAAMEPATAGAARLRLVSELQDRHHARSRLS